MSSTEKSRHFVIFTLSLAFEFHFVPSRKLWRGLYPSVNAIFGAAKHSFLSSLLYFDLLNFILLILKHFFTAAPHHWALWTWLISGSWENRERFIHLPPRVSSCSHSMWWWKLNTQHHLYPSSLADVLYKPVDVPPLIFWENERCRNTNY